MTRVAVGDIGTNTVRLLVAEVAGVEVDEVEVRTDVVGLGRGLHATGRLQPDAIQRTVTALGSFSAAFAAADRSIIVATSASRDALNRDDFFDAAEAACGIRPSLISGEQEAGFAFAGAAQAVPGERITVVDIGGGSTEFVTGTGHVESAVSIDIGSVRLTDLYLGDGPVSAEVLAQARRVARRNMVSAEVGVAGRPVGVAGTCTTVAGTLLGLTHHDRERTHLSTITLDDVQALIARLSSLDTSQIATVGTIGEKRAPVILGGLVVLEASLLAMGGIDMTISERDLLHGVAIALVST
jgi:exopolyphosphatase/guanosine-5'-triphosphate,3'-diphosphate pyrophosphatase